jgi:hypothetical protein
MEGKAAMWVKNAFISEKYPGDSHIIYDNNIKDMDSEFLKEVLTGKSWDSLTQKEIFSIRKYIPFFSKEGFKYYAPALMIAAIDELDEMDDLPDLLVSKFTLPAEIDIVMSANSVKEYHIDKSLNDFDFNEHFQTMLKYNNESIHDFIEFMAFFNKEQTIAVKSFLEYMIQYADDLMYDPQIAIERYWFQF